MTHKDKRENYELLLKSQKVIESSMSRTLIEQLVVEIVLKTVMNVKSAVEWICSTFMFVRIVANPEYYGSDVIQGNPESAYPFISEWCKVNVQKLSNLGLITLRLGNDSFEPTRLARIITKHCISLKTTERILSLLTEGHTLKTLLEEICKCKEVTRDVILRVSEKKNLNEYNKKNRFPYKGRIKDSMMKINCLLQATFQSISIEHSLYQDSQQLIRCAQRVAKCLIEVCLYLIHLNETANHHSSLKISKMDMPFETIINAIHLQKAFRAKLWHDTPFVAKQLSGIGRVIGTTLVECGFDSFDRILATNPRDIEFAIHRHPPFGSYMIQEVRCLFLCSINSMFLIFYLILDSIIAKL